MRNPGLIILAAGGSSRMGSPKQLLPWKGSTLLRNACEVALGTACHPIIIVLGCRATDCLHELEGLAFTSVPNPDWPKGMGTSLAMGITHLKQMTPDCPGALIMLVDQPTVTTTFLCCLLSTWKESSHAITATKYSHGGGVPAIFPRNYFEELQAFDADQGARALITRERSNVRLVDFEGDLIDVDDPTTYQKLSGLTGI